MTPVAPKPTVDPKPTVGPRHRTARLAGRRILVTGAASGIGRAVAELFHDEGAAVALLDRSPDVAGVASEWPADGRSIALRADLTDDAAIAEAVAAAVGTLGGLDGIVNAAGADLVRPFAEMSSAEWRAMIDINLTGPAMVCRAAATALTQTGGGTIVNISSGAGLRPLEHRTAYCAAKAGLVMFSKALAMDLAAFGIRVNAICPGIIDTPMFRRSYEDAPDPDAALAKIMDRFLIKRVGEPDDIAQAALYLTGAESRQVTGIALSVDGGRSFH